MAAVTGGLPTQSAAKLAQRVATPEDPLWGANINSATETMLGGTAKAIAAAKDSARREGRSSDST
ncbi:hypothetical protein [Mycolicibacterium agri]|nr:hypothetical protein [Mycolicibacterium agri]